MRDLGVPYGEMEDREGLFFPVVQASARYLAPARYDDLLTVASSLGEETEALFYEGTRLYVGGDRDKATAQFQRVLDTNMVSFYEFEMARKLLLVQSRPGAPVP